MVGEQPPRAEAAVAAAGDAGGLAWTPPRVLVLNGGSSSGKTSLARALQDVLDGVWLRLGVDTLIDAAPSRLLTGDGLDLCRNGQVRVGAAFSAVEDCWMAGIARMAQAGVGVIVEDAFVSGPRAQQRWRRALGSLPTCWVGVRCPRDVAVAREQARGDRLHGMAGSQADAVHEGIAYDLEIDSSVGTPEDLARTLRERVFGPASFSGPFHEKGDVGR